MQELAVQPLFKVQGAAPARSWATSLSICYRHPYVSTSGKRAKIPRGPAAVIDFGRYAGDVSQETESNRSSRDSSFVE